MARFRAYATDSEDDDSDTTPAPPSPVKYKPRAYKDNFQDEEGISEDDAMEQDVVAPPRTNGHRGGSEEPSDDNASDLDSDEEEVQGQQGRRARFSPSTRFSPTREDPTIIPWARELGVDAQRLHVMQTSLFRMPEEEAAVRSMNQQSDPKTFLANALNRKHSRDSEGEGMKGDSRQVKFLPHCLVAAAYSLFAASFFCSEVRSNAVPTLPEIRQS